MRAVLLVLPFASWGCGDGGVPGPGLEAPRPLFDGSRVEGWKWLPGGEEIVYSTPFSYPYTGPPTRFEAVDVASRRTRTIVPAPTNGDRLIGTRLSIFGGFLYFPVWSPGSGGLWIHRARIDGTAPAEGLVIEPRGGRIAASADGSFLAWIEGRALVVHDLAAGEPRSFPLEDWAEDVVVAPDGRSAIVVEAGWRRGGTPLQWVDLATGELRRWVAPDTIDLATNGSLSGLVSWQGDAPTLYAVVDRRTLTRFSVATGAREDLGALRGLADGASVTWSTDFRRVAFWRSRCREDEPSLFGGRFCVRSEHQLRMSTWSSGTESLLVHLETAGPPDAVRAFHVTFAPDGRRLAYSAGGSVYVLTLGSS